MALDRLIKIDGGGISTTSDYRVGVITASKFIGPFDGTAGNFSGIITASGANFSGNVTIGGTLTYEDVTNIDSVGLITARNGIKVSTGTATTALVVDGDARVTGILTIGTSSLKLDGPNNLVNVGTALTLGHTQGIQFHTQNLHSAGFEVNQINASGVITATSFVGSGAALTGIDATAIKDSSGNVKIQAQASGAIHSGVSTFQDIDVDGHTNLDNVSVAGVTTFAGAITAPDVITAGALLHEGDTNTLVHFSADDTIELKTGGFSRLSVTNNGVALTGGYLNANGNRIILGDSSGANDDRLVLGNNNDLQLFHDASDSYIQNQTGVFFIQNTGDLRIRVDNTDAAIHCVRNGAVELYHNNVKRLETSSVGVSIPQDLDVDGHTNLDNVNIAGVSTFSGVVRVPAGSASAPAIHFGDSDSGLYSAAGGSNNVRITAGGSDVLTASTNSVNFTIKATALTSFTLGSQSAHTKPLYFADASSVESSSILLDNSSQELRIKNGRFAGQITFTTYNTEKVRITSGGSVLINTTVDTQASADGNELIIGSTSNTHAGMSIVGSTSGGIGNIFFSDGASYKNQGIISYRHADDSMRFTVDQYEALRILADGEVRVNATKGTNNVPAHLRLHCGDVSIAASQAVGQIRFAGRDAGGTDVSRTGALIQATAAGTWDTTQSSGYSATHLDFFTQNNSGTDTVAAGARLRITSDGNVNIGTSERDQTNRLLNVYGGQTRTTMTTAGNAFEVFSHTGSGQSYGILCQGGTTANDYAATFRNTSGNTLFRIRGDGNIGIGLDNPDQLLHIYESDGSSQAYVHVQNNRSRNAAIKFTTTQGSWLVGQGIGVDADRFSIYDTQERFIINSSGDVGIGQLAPAGKLHISSGTSGDCKLIIEADTDNNAEGDNPQIEFRQDGGVAVSAIGHGLLSAQQNGLVLANGVSNGYISFATGTTDGHVNATERFRITPKGDVCVNNMAYNTYETAGTNINTMVDNNEKRSGVYWINYGGEIFRAYIKANWCEDRNWILAAKFFDMQDMPSGSSLWTNDTWVNESDFNLYGGIFSKYPAWRYFPFDRLAMQMGNRIPPIMRFSGNQTLYGAFSGGRASNGGGVTASSTYPAMSGNTVTYHSMSNFMGPDFYDVGGSEDRIQSYGLNKWANNSTQTTSAQNRGSEHVHAGARQDGGSLQYASLKGWGLTVEDSHPTINGIDSIAVAGAWIGCPLDEGGSTQGSNSSNVGADSGFGFGFCTGNPGRTGTAGYAEWGRGTECVNTLPAYIWLSAD